MRSADLMELVQRPSCYLNIFFVSVVPRAAVEQQEGLLDHVWSKPSDPWGRADVPTRPQLPQTWEIVSACRI